MKFLFIIGLLGFGFQSAGQTPALDDSVEDMISSYASEIKNCDVDELSISSFNDVKNICQGLISSKVCSNIKPEYLVDCDDLMLTGYGKVELSANRPSVKEACEEGLHELNDFETSLIPVADKTNKVKEDVEWSAELVDNTKSTINYYKTEADRFKIEGPDWPTWDALTKSDEFGPEFGCLNIKGQRKVECSYFKVKQIHWSNNVMSSLGTNSFIEIIAAFLPFSLPASIVAVTTGNMGASATTLGGSQMAGDKLIPQQAMMSVRKENSSSNLSTSSALSSSDTNSSSAGE